MKKATLYFDGGTYPMNPGHGGAGAVLVLEDGAKHSFSQYLGENKTNNQAEYGGLLLGLRKAVVSMPDDLPVCEPRSGLEKEIATLNAQGEGARFKSWLSLKSGNDRYSKLRGEKLIAQVPEVVRDAIANSLTPKELAEGLLDKCFRWWCRGLSAPSAVKKVRVDAEIAAKFAQK